ncbi:hypothetical protein ACZ87_03147, partial [Candidatus Erwinia dacicola]
KNGIEAYPYNPCCIVASGTVHRPINDGLMGFWFSSVVAIAELEGLQALVTAIELRP